ncbi:MAG: hypothetical protein QOH83_181 [Solirubrobacteraceae bacterium]|jgi:hypothetical protein|nr:hypothetical protein [Solirubrobacteraceae bacterium]
MSEATQLVKQGEQPPAHPLLGSIVCTPPSPEAGESVCIQVLDPDGKPYGDAEAAITINGVPGALQWVRWRRPGKRLILVAGRRDGRGLETMSTTVTVRPATGEGHPWLEVRCVPEAPTTAILSVRRPRAKVAPETHVSLPPLEVARPVDESEALGSVKPTYSFDFGDGSSLATGHAQVWHDYGTALNPGRSHGMFHVTVTVAEAGKEPLTFRRSVSVLNLYHLARQRGVLQPPVTTSSFRAVTVEKATVNADHKPDPHYSANFSVRNPESKRLVLSRQRIEPILASSSERATVSDPQPVHLELKPTTETSIDVLFPTSTIPADAVGFIVRYDGTTAEGETVRVCACFDVPEHMQRSLRPVDGPSQIFLDGLVQQKLVGSTTSITLREIEALAARDLISAPAPHVRAASPAHAATQAGFRPSLGPAFDQHVEFRAPVEGNECDPDNLPDNLPDDFVCQATDRHAWVAFPGRFMNARKGDIVLSPGDGGLVAQMMANVSPPQHFSHSGIMSRNHDEITHSTGSVDRLLAHPNGAIFGHPAPIDGYAPADLKFLWPGSITQTVEDAVHGEWMDDPEPDPNGVVNSFLVAGFDVLEAEQGGDRLTSGTVRPALVVKPDPLAETDDIRLKLHDIANHAVANVGKSHYRFFCYTDPTIGLSDHGSGGGWASGTFPSTCASYLWIAARKAGVALEGTLDRDDLVAGVRVERDLDSPDGLYLYRADERLAAGSILYDLVTQQVDETLAEQGLIAELAAGLDDMEDDVANQLLNAFASDWCSTDAKDSDKWRHTTDANSVSADDLMRWDAPLYGCTEPLIYFPPRYERVRIHRWKKVQLKGNLRGTVHYDGKPVAGAQIQLFDGKTTHTDHDGHFAFTAVPVGMYDCHAQKVEHGGLYLSASKDVTIKSNATTELDIALRLPSNMYRKVVIDGVMMVTDVHLIGSDVTVKKNIYAALLVGPYSTHDEASFDAVADEDNRGRMIFTADWQIDKSVKLTMTGNMYDGPSDHDSFTSNTFHFSLDADAQGKWRMIQPPDDAQCVWCNVSISNEVQNSG